MFVLSEKGQNPSLDGMADAQRAELNGSQVLSRRPRLYPNHARKLPSWLWEWALSHALTLHVSCWQVALCSEALCKCTEQQDEHFHWTPVARYSMFPIFFPFKTCSWRCHEVLASSPHYETPQPVNDAGGKSPGLHKENLFCGKQVAEVPSHRLGFCWFSTMKILSVLIQEMQIFFFNIFKCRAGK